MILKVIVEKI